MGNQKTLFNSLGRGFFHLLIFTGLGGVACSDEMERPSCSAYVSFSPTVEHSWYPITRASENTFRDTVVPLPIDGGKELYLHTIYSDDIIPPSPLTCDKGAPATRAVPVKEENMYNTFGVSAYTYAGSWDGSQTPEFMYDISVKSSGNYWMTTPSSYEWPGSAYKVRFFAYAPKGEAAYQLSGQAAVGAPTLICTIPGDVSEQKDLLVAGSGELSGSTHTAVDLTFRHVLTAVRFVYNPDNMPEGTIKSITLKNVYSQGVYNMETDDWHERDAKLSFSQVVDKQISGTEGNEITNPSQTFMMIPQTLPDDAAIEIIFDDGKQERTLTADLKNSEWPQGRTVTYKISDSTINREYTLDVIVPPSSFSYMGGTDTFTISSYNPYCHLS